MSRHLGTETSFEQATIARLLLLGCTHVPGPEIERPYEEVILVDVLRESLAPSLPVTHIGREGLGEGMRRSERQHVLYSA